MPASAQQPKHTDLVMLDSGILKPEIDRIGPNYPMQSPHDHLARRAHIINKVEPGICATGSRSIKKLQGELILKRPDVYKNRLM